MSLKQFVQPLMEKQNNKCAGCNEVLDGTDLKEVDHIVEKAQGGPTDETNLQILCIECHWNKSGNRPNSPHPLILALYKHYKLYQNKAGAAERQIKAFTGQSKGKTKSNYVTEDTLDLLTDEMARAKGLEKTYLKKLEEVVTKTEEWKWMKDVNGLGVITAGLLLGKVQIDKANTVSSLWKYLGYDPGKKNPGKSRMFKSALYTPVSIMIMKKDPPSPYRQDYDAARNQITEKHGKVGAHGKALHRVTKLWLAHLWETWRRNEGLSVVGPYAQVHMKHTGIITAKQRGWN